MSSTCRDCKHWRRAKAVVPINFGACGAIDQDIFDFTDVKASIRRIGRPGMMIEGEPTEFVTDRDFSCSNFAAIEAMEVNHAV